MAIEREYELLFKDNFDRLYYYAKQIVKDDGVLGTELNVSCYDGASSHVALINGSVEVKPKSSAKAVRLQPGQGATISGNESVAVAAEDMEGYEQ